MNSSCKNGWALPTHPSACFRLQPFWQKLSVVCIRSINLLHQHSVGNGKLQPTLYRDQRPLEGIKYSCLVVPVGYLLTRIQAGFPGIQKARGRTPAKWRAGALLALVSAMSLPFMGMLVSTRAAAVSSRAVVVAAACAGREMLGGIQRDLDLSCCCL